MSSESTEKVHILLPSAWAKLDAETSTIYEMMSNQNNESSEHGMCSAAKQTKTKEKKQNIG